MNETLTILSLKAYAAGYTGILEQSDAYVLFYLTRTGRYKKLRTFDKSDFTNLSHFKSVITKFIPARSFLETPVGIENPSASPAELIRILNACSREISS